MGSAEPEPAPDDQDDQGEKPAAKPPASERPLWLVGAEEGFQQEVASSEATPTDARDGVVLRRPGGGIVDPKERLLRDAPPEPEEAAKATPAPAGPPPPVAWKAAASSIPVLRNAPDQAPPAEGRTDVGQPVPEEEAELERKPFPSGSSVRPLPPPARPAMTRALRPPSSRQRAPWDDAIDSLRDDRRVQFAALAAVLVIVAVIAFWPHKAPPTSISNIVNHASQFDGKAVEVRGRVGEVNSFGGGWAYYLSQGHSTIAIFGRNRRPKPEETVTIRGMVSTGYLDGAPRLAIFEDPAP